MTNRAEYKEALSEVDRNIRLCLLYLEGLIEEKFKLVLKVKQPQVPKIPKVDFSMLESKDDSLQKQIDGLRVKVDAAQIHIQKHDEDRIFLKKLTKNAEEMVDNAKKHFEELYESGYYREGTKRKIREAGLME